MIATLIPLALFALTGLAAGHVTGLVTRDRPFGLLADLALGLVGAVAAGWLYIAFVPGLPFGLTLTFTAAIAGALVLLIAVRLVRRR
ncbi:GlsB/YeaQ/YmgE family stress response membrane protein [Hyphobacterium marinum]|uniref:GlsB/YeaQ/YmgE family stress response membrane protein n=1 Tax=Hyphobacterium marinum TaxID=3116574 RepID=A0ABU7M0V1_9PROT|nr:GlsB/YeaQ/YmgE family stress response membrane protein [Hyphobacterium sp. Y6023]MEE2567442.1 GlsB/YeaQ/YmgE family stress response membrane protein [Hyphobacterium sp. Y6023]